MEQKIGDVSSPPRTSKRIRRLPSRSFASRRLGSRLLRDADGRKERSWKEDR